MGKQKPITRIKVCPLMGYNGVSRIAAANPAVLWLEAGQCVGALACLASYYYRLLFLGLPPFDIRRPRKRSISSFVNTQVPPICMAGDALPCLINLRK